MRVRVEDVGAVGDRGRERLVSAVIGDRSKSGYMDSSRMSVGENTIIAVTEFGCSRISGLW
jgi:hypothetical protein